MNSYYQPNTGGIRIIRDGLRDQANYESLMKTAGAPPATREEGSGFWLVSIIVLILTAIFSMFAGAKNESVDAPEAGHDDGVN